MTEAWTGWYATAFDTPASSTTPTPDPVVASTGATRFSIYVDNVRSGQLTWRYELIGDDGSLLATNIEADTDGVNVVYWGATAPPLTLDVAGRAPRLGSLIVPETTAALVPRSRSSILHPDAGSRVRVSAGLILADGTTRWYVQGTLAIDFAEAVTEDGVTVTRLELLDPVAVLDGLRLDRSVEWAAGTAVEAVVSRLLALAIDNPARYSVTPTGYTLPAGSLAPGDELEPALADLLGGCGHELIADVYGRLISRPVPSSSDAASVDAWRYGQADGLPIDSFSVPFRRREPRGVVVESGSLQSEEPQVVRRVIDNDRGSLGYWDGTGPVDLDSVSYTWLQSVTQADAAGLAYLRLNGSGPGVVQMSVAPNPCMRQYDTIKIEDPATGAESAYQVLGYSLPLEVDGMMTVTARHLWDPAANINPPIDLLPGFETSFTDDFERADEDLQGTNWTELGWSWGVVGGRAVQRYRWGWSLALVNKRMDRTDHRAQIDIANLPTGKRIGPVIRSSGTFEGYAALVDPDGQVSLESWVNGVSEERLASASTVGTPVGKTLLIQAVGNLIEVKMNGVTVISTTDDRHLGDRVGMLADGAAESNAPAAETFTAAQAS